MNGVLFVTMILHGNFFQTYDGVRDLLQFPFVPAVALLSLKIVYLRNIALALLIYVLVQTSVQSANCSS